MFLKFLKKKVQDIDRTHNSIVEAHFLGDHMVPNFFSSEQLYESAATLNFAQNLKNLPKSPKLLKVPAKSPKKGVFQKNSDFDFLFFCDTTIYGLTTGEGIFQKSEK